MEYRPISIVIPSWNGKELLKKYLPSVVAALEAYPASGEIIVVDDGSCDGTGEFIQSNYPSIRLISLESNCGFAKTSNMGISKSQYDIVVLLNNDMLVEKDFLKPLSQYFADAKTFGVLPATPRMYNEPYPEQEYIRFGLRLRYGFIECPIIQLKDNLSRFPYTFKVSGGIAALDRKKFMEIGGFDGLFSPFYWEDVDLSYRVWKRSWQIVYEPKSLVYHQGRSTINPDNFNPNYIKTISERNRYLLIWKNITNKVILLRHIAFIPLRLCTSVFHGQLTVSLNAFFSALKILPLIIKKRRMQKRHYLLSDKEIFKMFEFKKVS